MAKCRNFLAQLIVVQFAAANTELAVTHNLVGAEGVKTIPRGFLVCRRGQAASVYDSGTPWTNTTAYLKSDVTNAWFVLIFFA